MLSDFTTTVLYTFLLFQQPGQLSRNPGGGKCVFLLHNVRPGSGAHPASYSMDTGVKHSGREVYHLSPPTAEVMNEWSCIYFPPFPSYHERGLFSYLSYARYIPHPSRRCNEVAMQCEAPVIQISACCYLPGPHIQPPHHSALQPTSVC